MRLIGVLLFAVVLVGCGPLNPIGSVRTYAAPVPSGAAADTVRIVPKPPIVSRTKARYEWQVVCDREFGSFSTHNETTTISGGHPVDRLHGGLPTVFTYYVEVETTPHGDGSMAVKVTNGQQQAETRPLLTPSAKPTSGGGGYVSSGNDGYPDAPAASFVHPLVLAATDLKLPATVELARIDLGASNLGFVTASKPDGKGGMKEAYRKLVTLGPKGAFPPGAMSSPALQALTKQGYMVMGQSSGTPRKETLRLIVNP